MDIVIPVDNWKIERCVQLCNALYYKQLSETRKIISSFVSPDWPIHQANKTNINFVIFILVFVANCL